MLFLKTKTQLALNVNSSGELGGSRFSCILRRPQSELKSAQLMYFQHHQTIPSGETKVNVTICLCI